MGKPYSRRFHNSMKALFHKVMEDSSDLRSYPNRTNSSDLPGKIKSAESALMVVLEKINSISPWEQAPPPNK